MALRFVLENTARNTTTTCLLTGSRSEWLLRNATLAGSHRSGRLRGGMPSVGIAQGLRGFGEHESFSREPRVIFVRAPHVSCVE